MISGSQRLQRQTSMPQSNAIRTMAKPISALPMPILTCANLGSPEGIGVAEKVLGDSEQLHVIRGTAYGQRGQVVKAANEYRLALKFSPDDPSLHVALAGVLYSAAPLSRVHRRARGSRKSLPRTMPTSTRCWPVPMRNSGIENRPCRMCSWRSRMPNSCQRKRNKPGSGPSAIYLSTGSALSVLGDQAGAMDRFGRAFTAPGSDRVGVRLAIAQVMVHEGHADDARRQIALA